MRLLLLCLCLLVLTTGCASLPQTHNFQKTRTLDKGYDASWERTIQFFAQNDWSIKNLEKDSGIITSEVVSPQTLLLPPKLDCGTSGILMVLGYNINFNVFVRRAEERTEVTVNVFGSQVRKFGEQPPFLVPCVSTGVLEQQIFDHISRP